MKNIGEKMQDKHLSPILNMPIRDWLYNLSIRGRLHAILIFLILMPHLSCKQKPANNQINFKQDTTLKIITSDNQELHFDVELAIDDYQRERGLMYRYKLEQNQGMLFIFDRQEIRSFWMKNTYISLDMLFIDENFYIVDIHENAFPLSEESILSRVPAKYVFEIRGGLCRRLNIQIGDKIDIKI